jgi:hypothetical protein
MFSQCEKVRFIRAARHKASASDVSGRSQSTSPTTVCRRARRSEQAAALHAGGLAARHGDDATEFPTAILGAIERHGDMCGDDACGDDARSRGGGNDAGEETMGGTMRAAKRCGRRRRGEETTRVHHRLGSRHRHAAITTLPGPESGLQLLLMNGARKTQ